MILCLADNSYLYLTSCNKYNSIFQVPTAVATGALYISSLGGISERDMREKVLIDFPEKSSETLK